MEELAEALSRIRAVKPSVPTEVKYMFPPAVATPWDSPMDALAAVPSEAFPFTATCRKIAKPFTPELSTSAHPTTVDKTRSPVEISHVVFGLITAFTDEVIIVNAAPLLRARDCQGQRGPILRMQDDGYRHRRNGNVMSEITVVQPPPGGLVDWEVVLLNLIVEEFYNMTTSGYRQCALSAGHFRFADVQECRSEGLLKGSEARAERDGYLRFFGRGQCLRVACAHKNRSRAHRPHGLLR